MSSSNKNKNNNSFDKYCSRLGYPHNMAKDAQKKLGNQASNSELLAAVLNNAKANGVQPNRSTHPNYLQKQVRRFFRILYHFFRRFFGKLNLNFWFCQWIKFYFVFCHYEYLIIVMILPEHQPTGLLSDPTRSPESTDLDSQRWQEQEQKEMRWVRFKLLLSFKR